METCFKCHDEDLWLPPAPCHRDYAWKSSLAMQRLTAAIQGTFSPHALCSEHLNTNRSLAWCNSLSESCFISNERGIIKFSAPSNNNYVTNQRTDHLTNRPIIGRITNSMKMEPDDWIPPLNPTLGHDTEPVNSIPTGLQGTNFRKSQLTQFPQAFKEPTSIIASLLNFHMPMGNQFS